MPIKHVCFDCDGTLYETTAELNKDINLVVSEYLSKQLNMPRTDLMDDYLKRVKKYKTKTKAISSYGFSEEIAREIINKIDIASFVKPDTKLVDMICELSAKGISVSIFTNNKSSTLENILDNLGFPKKSFNFTVTAEKVPPKPSIEGYLHVLRESKTPAYNLLFVGDRLEADIEPARQTGMHTMQVRSPEKTIDFDEKSKTYHFKRKDIYQVPKVIRIVDFLLLRQ